MGNTKAMGYLPLRLHNALLRICEENGLSLKEVVATMVRRQLEEKYAFTCKHERVREAVNTRKPYCYMCWRRLEEVDVRNKRVKRVNGKPEITGVTYTEIPTFLERKQQQQLTAEEIQELR